MTDKKMSMLPSERRAALTSSEKLQALNDLMDEAELALLGIGSDFTRFGDIRATWYGGGHGLVILNYGAKCQYKKPDEWTIHERVCRGLILDWSGEVVALPFEKFWNWGESAAPADGARLLDITDKEDGSLGIMYRLGSELRVATRGSFSSPQAVWATEQLNLEYPSLAARLPHGITLLFEIMYPKVGRFENGLEHLVVMPPRADTPLVLIGATLWDNELIANDQPYRSDKRSTYDLTYDELIDLAYEFNLRVVDGDTRQWVQDTKTDEQLIAEYVTRCKTDTNIEGWVARYSDGSRYKIKTDWYKVNQRLIANMTEKYVAAFYRMSLAVAHAKDERLDLLDIHKDLMRDYEHLSSDYRTQIEGLSQRIVNRVVNRIAECAIAHGQCSEYAKLCSESSDATNGEYRKHYAFAVNARADTRLTAPYLFKLRDGLDPDKLAILILEKEF